MSASPDVDIQYIGGADPEMVFLDKDYNEVEVRTYVYMYVCVAIDRIKKGVDSFSFTF